MIVSDVHLGSDIHNQAQQGFGIRSKQVDLDFESFLRHYRMRKPNADRWRLIIAGDFIDFIGMVISAEVSGEVSIQELNDEERAHGLGNGEAHARVKMRRVAERHDNVMTELAAFVADGNSVTLVHGNHDLEFHWPGVQEEFREQLWRRVEVRPESMRPSDVPNTDVNEDPKESFHALVTFEPWFFYVQNTIYVEHGHQYDPYCAAEHVMAPFSPKDPKRSWRGFSEVLLRYVVRPTHGMHEHGHENTSALHYVRFGLALGVRGAFRLGVRFVYAMLELFRLRRAYFSEAGKALAKEHERRMGLLAKASQIGIERLKALAALHAPPVTRSIRSILGSVFLDKLALGMAAVIAMILVAFFQARSGHRWAGAGLVLLAWAFMHRHLTKARKVDPGDTLAERAVKLATLFPAEYIVMGHTHVPVKRKVTDQTTYVNLGSWAEEEPQAGRQFVYRAARTHLVIETREDDPLAARGTFLEWHTENGVPAEIGTQAREKEELARIREALRDVPVQSGEVSIGASNASTGIVRVDASEGGDEARAKVS